MSMETKPVKLIPKDFSDPNLVKGDKSSQRRQIQSMETNPVKGDKFSQWRQNQLNRFLKIFLRQSQSMETKPVKLIPKDFSEAKPVNGDKNS